MAQNFIDHRTSLPVWSLDDDGNTIQVGTATLGDGVVVKRTPAPDNPSSGALKVFSPDGEALYTIDSTGHMSIISAGAGVGGTPDWYNIKAFGAKGDGVTNDSVAIQDAINAASAAGGGNVYAPVGTYRVTSALVMKTKVNLIGDGKGVSVLKATANNLISFTANAFWWSIQGMTLQATGGHVIAGTNNISAFLIYQCSLQALSSNKSIWNQTTGQIVEAYVSNCDLFVDGNPRTVPAVDWLDPLGGFNSNVFEKCVATNNADNTQYFFRLRGAQTINDFSYTNTFRDIVFETCSGGGISATSQFGLMIENCWMWDDPVGGIMNAPFFIGKEAAGLASRNTTFNNVGRLGNHLAVGVVDILLDATCQQTTIQDFRATPDAGKIDMGGSAYVQLINKSPGTILTNTSGTAYYYADSNTSNNVALDTRVTGDTQPRGQFKIDGSILWGPGNTAADTNLYRNGVGDLRTDTLMEVGGNLNVEGNLKVVTVTKGLQIKEGTNATMGTATLNGTTAVTVTTQAALTNSRIFLTIQTPGGTPASPYVFTRTNGTSFQIKSTGAADTSVVAWLIVNPL